MSVRSAREPTGSTRLAGVIGHPVRYSLSPALHNAAYRSLGIDAIYLAMPVLPDDVGVAVQAVRALDMLGVSVTIPLKETVVPHLDRLSDVAARLGAVNCIAFEDDRLVGHNTDGDGFVASLREVGFDFESSTVAMFGAGGSAKAVAIALVDAGAACVRVVNRNVERARQLVELSPRIELGNVACVPESDLIVNATPVGMAGRHGGELPFDASLIRTGQTVVDLVYHPLDTPLLVAAAERGAVAVHGAGMLLHQAAEQIRLWTGLVAPIEVMRSALETS